MFHDNKIIRIQMKDFLIVSMTAPKRDLWNGGIKVICDINKSCLM